MTELHKASGQNFQRFRPILMLVIGLFLGAGAMAVATSSLSSDGATCSAPKSLPTYEAKVVLGAETFAQLDTPLVILEDQEPIPEVSLLELEISSKLQNWLNSWQTKDLESFFSFYSTEFYPDQYFSTPGWRSYKSQIISKSNDISIEIDELKVLSFDDNLALVTFQQEYSSSIYRDSVRKFLILKNDGNTWSYIREFAIPAVFE